MQRASFFIEGPVGDYEAADTIAKKICEFVESEEGQKYRKALTN